MPGGKLQGTVTGMCEKRLKSGKKVARFYKMEYNDFMTRPQMRIKVGRLPHDIRIGGRIV